MAQITNTDTKQDKGHLTYPAYTESGYNAALLFLMAHSTRQLRLEICFWPVKVFIRENLQKNTELIVVLALAENLFQD